MLQSQPPAQQPQQPQLQPSQVVMPQVVTAPSGVEPATSRSFANRVPAPVLRGHRIMGLLQLLTGVLVIAISIVGMASGSGNEFPIPQAILFFPVSGGFWSGPFFIAAGISGLSAARTGSGCTLCSVVTCLVFSIIASAMAFSVMVVQADYLAARCHLLYESSAVFGTFVATVLLCAFEFVLAIVHSAYACRASCCCVPAAVHAHQDQQVVNLTRTLPGPAGGRPQPAGHFLHAQAGYPGQQAGYPGPQVGYPGPQVGYPGQQAGYPGQQAGYPGQQAGYPGQQAGYPGQQAGYPGQQAGPSYGQASAPPPSYESSEKGGGGGGQKF